MCTREVDLKDTPFSPSGLKKVLESFGVFPKKSLGQHFLTNYQVVERILKLSGFEGETPVVEFGAGLGILTYALARRAPRVVAYELDQRLIEILKNLKVLPSNVELRCEDILSVDYEELSKELGCKLTIFGNLPYYLSSRLLFKIYERSEVINACVFMFQKEVVERLLASPGSKSYGLLSVLTRVLTEARELMVLSPQHFYPRPEVSSSVVLLRFKKVRLEPEFFSFIKRCFRNRRKKLLKNLAETKRTRSQLEECFRKCEISLDARAEELNEEDFQRLYETLKVEKLINDVIFLEERGGQK